MYACGHWLDNKQFLVVTLMFWEAFSNISCSVFVDNFQPGEVAGCSLCLDSAAPQWHCFVACLFAAPFCSEEPEAPSWVGDCAGGDHS